MISISRDHVTKVLLLMLHCHLYLTSKHLLMVGLASDSISHYIHFPSINMKVTTKGFIAGFTNMELDTFGGAKLQFLQSRLGVDELVHKVGLLPTGGDGEQVINETQRGNGDQVLVVVEVLGLL